jgi:histidinol-phosphate aminotransferase
VPVSWRSGPSDTTASRLQSDRGAALSAAGVKVWPSEGNFLLADFGSAEKAKAADAALKSRGLIMRAMGGYGLPMCLRISIGTGEECQMVADAIAAFTAQHG